MSLDRFSTLFTLVPEATSTSYIVTVGPRWAADDLRVDAEGRAACRSSASMHVLSRARRRRWTAAPCAAGRATAAGRGPSDVVDRAGLRGPSGARLGASSVRSARSRSASGSTTIVVGVGLARRQAERLPRAFERPLRLGASSSRLSRRRTSASRLVAASSTSATRRWSRNVPPSDRDRRPREDQEPEHGEPERRR